MEKKKKKDWDDKSLERFKKGKKSPHKEKVIKKVEEDLKTKKKSSK